MVKPISIGFIGLVTSTIIFELQLPQTETHQLCLSFLAICSASAFTVGLLCAANDVLNRYAERKARR